MEQQAIDELCQYHPYLQRLVSATILVLPANYPPAHRFTVGLFCCFVVSLPVVMDIRIYIVTLQGDLIVGII